jgi:nitrogen fixation-related uncharacterized protein
MLKSSIPDWFLIFVALPMAMLVVASAVYGLYWASKRGQLQNLDEGAKVIFDDEEPIGKPTDQILNQKKPSKGPPS